jgi:hypothetical protein
MKSVTDWNSDTESQTQVNSPKPNSSSSLDAQAKDKEEPQTTDIQPPVTSLKKPSISYSFSEPSLMTKDKFHSGYSLKKNVVSEQSKISKASFVSNGAVKKDIRESTPAINQKRKSSFESQNRKSTFIMRSIGQATLVPNEHTSKSEFQGPPVDTKEEFEYPDENKTMIQKKQSKYSINKRSSYTDKKPSILDDVIEESLEVEEDTRNNAMEPILEAIPEEFEQEDKDELQETSGAQVTSLKSLKPTVSVRKSPKIKGRNKSTVVGSTSIERKHSKDASSSVVTQTKNPDSTNKRSNATIAKQTSISQPPPNEIGNLHLTQKR